MSDLAHIIGSSACSILAPVTECVTSEDFFILGFSIIALVGTAALMLALSQLHRA
jgi:hypothetical protein